MLQLEKEIDEEKRKRREMQEKLTVSERKVRIVKIILYLINIIELEP